MQYSEKVLDHFTHPRNVGEIEDANGVGEVGNAKCGDIMKIYLKVSDDGVIAVSYTHLVIVPVLSMTTVFTLFSASSRCVSETGRGGHAGRQDRALRQP